MKNEFYQLAVVIDQLPIANDIKYIILKRLLIYYKEIDCDLIDTYNVLDLYLRHGFSDWNMGMAYAAHIGHSSLVDKLILLGADDWNLGMAYAARIGNSALVDKFISLGANNWNWGMVQATLGGHPLLVSKFNKLKN